MMRNEITSLDGGWRARLLMRTRRAARISPFRRWTQTLSVSPLLVSLTLVFLFTGCASAPAPLAARTTARHEQSAKPEAAWPQPPDVPIFGFREPDAILIYVIGEVNQPGGYYLSRPANVRDAVAAAGGTGDFAWWKIYWGVLRPHAFRYPTLIESEGRQRAELIELEDGDQVFFGYEVY